LDSTYTVIESQADWVTFTSNGHPRDSRLFEWGRSVMRAEEGRGGKRVPWALRGYAGEHCGKASVGERPGSDIVQLSGQAAADHLREGYSRCSSVTRLDLAVTVRSAMPDQVHEWAQWSRFLDWRRENGSPMKGRFITDADGGATAYIGSRQSELFLRIYDKEAECRQADDDKGAEHYAGCHRYELEVKGRRAFVQVEKYLDADNPAFMVRCWLTDWLRRHGMDSEPINNRNVALSPGFRRRTDTQTRLRWLENQVQPTIEWLKYHGHEAQVFRALGYNAESLEKYLQRDDLPDTEGVEL